MSVIRVEAKYYVLASISVMLAWGLEYYDAILFGTLSSILESVFNLTLVSTWFAFAVTYLVRPLGAILFGYVGDRFGRRLATMADSLAIGLSSLAIALLPTYREVGLLAPILLYVFRIIIGLGLGGEAGGGATWALEQVNPRWKPILNGVMYSGLSWAVFLTAFVSSLTLARLGKVAFQAWGWRIPFAVGAALAIVALVIRVFGLESPEWSEAKARGRVRRVPLASRDVWNLGMLILILINLGLTIYYYGGLGYWTYTIPVKVAPAFHVSRTYAEGYVFTLAEFGGLGAVVGEVLSGLLVNAVGIRRAFIYPSVALLATSIPLASYALAFNPYSPYLSFISGILFGLAAAPQTMYFTSLFPVESRWSAVSLGWNINSVVGSFAALLSVILIEEGLATGQLALYGSLLMVLGSLLVIVGAAIKPRRLYAKAEENYMY